jgi:hypothetical protein
MRTRPSGNGVDVWLRRASASRPVGSVAVPGADWLTAWFTFAITSVALRDAAFTFADTAYVTTPLPVPDDGVVSAIHAGSEDTVQGHPAGAVTVTLPVPVTPAVALNASDVGEIVGAGKHTAAAWLTAKLLAAMVSVALRAPALFAVNE